MDKLLMSLSKEYSQLILQQDLAIEIRIGNIATHLINLMKAIIKWPRQPEIVLQAAKETLFQKLQQVKTFKKF